MPVSSLEESFHKLKLVGKPLVHSQWLYRSDHWCTVSGYIGVTTGDSQWLYRSNHWCTVSGYIGVTTGAQSVVI